jgi:hypothetical protein
MKTPKEKAEQMFNDMKGFRVKHIHSKKCAIKAVIEVISALEEYGKTTFELQNMESEFRWWDEVKTELEKL